MLSTCILLQHMGSANRWECAEVNAEVKVDEKHGGRGSKDQRSTRLLPPCVHCLALRMNGQTARPPPLTPPKGRPPFAYKEAIIPPALKSSGLPPVSEHPKSAWP